MAVNAWSYRLEQDNAASLYDNGKPLTALLYTNDGTTVGVKVKINDAGDVVISELRRLRLDEAAHVRHNWGRRYAERWRQNSWHSWHSSWRASDGGSWSDGWSDGWSAGWSVGWSAGQSWGGLRREDSQQQQEVEEPGASAEPGTRQQRDGTNPEQADAVLATADADRRSSADHHSRSRSRARALSDTTQLQIVPSLRPFVAEGEGAALAHLCCMWCNEKLQFLSVDCQRRIAFTFFKAAFNPFEHLGDVGPVMNPSVQDKQWYRVMFRAGMQTSAVNASDDPQNLWTFQAAHGTSHEGVIGILKDKQIRAFGFVGVYCLCAQQPKNMTDFLPVLTKVINSSKNTSDVVFEFQAAGESVRLTSGGTQADDEVCAGGKVSHMRTSNEDRWCVPPHLITMRAMHICETSMLQVAMTNEHLQL